jgi:hypothetical protein
MDTDRLHGGQLWLEIHMILYVSIIMHQHDFQPYLSVKKTILNDDACDLSLFYKNWVKCILTYFMSKYSLNDWYSHKHRQIKMEFGSAPFEMKRILSI